MPILSGGPLYRDKSKPIEDYTASTGEVIGAAGQRAIDTGITDVFGQGLVSLIGQSAAKADPERYSVSAVDAKAEAAKRGVSIDLDDDASISRPELDVMLRLKERERKQMAVLNRRPKTWGGFGAELLGGIGGSLLDPVQAAASFIPVVSAARYAAWTAKAATPLGRAGVRAGVGAVEGLAGAAILEPLAYTRAQSLGLDYTAQDSFLNLAFGTVLGGGLHVMGGAAFDAVSPARRAAGEAPEAKGRQALAEAVTALDDGRAFDATPVFQDGRFMAQEVNRAPDITDVDLTEALADIQALKAGQAERADDLIEEIKSLGGIKIVDNEGRITSEGGDVRDVFNKRYPIGLVNNRNGVPLDYVREALQERGWLPKAADDMPDDTSTADVLDLLARWSAGDKPRKIGEARNDDLTGVADDLKAAGVKATDADDVAAFRLAKHRIEKARRSAPELVREPAIMPDTYDPATGYEPPDMERVRVEADEALARGDDDIDGEIEALNELLGMAEKREPLSEADRAALELADAFEANAARSANSYRAAAACLSGLA